MSISSSPRANRFGCFAYGCGFASVLMIVLVGGLGYYFISSVRSAFYLYSSTSAPVIEARPIDPAVARSAEEKWRILQTAFEAGSAVSVDFSGDEIMGLLNRGLWRNRFDLIVNDDTVSARFGFPVQAIGRWPAAEWIFGSDGMKRYIQGALRAAISVRDGKVTVRFDELNLNGQALEDMARGHASQWVVGALNAGGEDVGQGEREDRAVLGRVKVLDIRQGRIYLVLSERSSPE